MKKKVLAACVLALLLLAGCANGKADTPLEDNKTASGTTAEKSAEETTPAADGKAETPTEDGAAVSDGKDGQSAENTAPGSDAASDASAAEGKTVLPLPSGIDMEHLEDCTVAVSFEKGGAYVDDTGAMQLRVKVYAYDVFDMVDISMLQTGDQLMICQQPVEVTSLERDKDGAVLINGGLDYGGYTLTSSEEGGFSVIGYDDAKDYYELGEATIPVSERFEFEDASELDQEPRTYYAGDFLTDDAGIVYHFVPNNTALTIEGGYAVHLQRNYLP